MSTQNACDISLAITGSGGAGAITAGELLLSLAGNNGCFGMMRQSFGPQIRGGEAAALVRISHRPVECMDDGFDLLLALDWQNADRFAEEIALRPDGLIIADPDAGAIPAAMRELGAQISAVPMKALARDIPAGRPNMVALGLLSHWLGISPDAAGRLIDHVFHAKGEAISPLYEHLTGEAAGHPDEVKWNFEKFLIGRDGRLVARFPSAVKPTDPELTEAIEKELAKESNR